MVTGIATPTYAEAGRQRPVCTHSRVPRLKLPLKHGFPQAPERPASPRGPLPLPPKQRLVASIGPLLIGGPLTLTHVTVKVSAMVLCSSRCPSFDSGTPIARAPPSHAAVVDLGAHAAADFSGKTRVLGAPRAPVTAWFFALAPLCHVERTHDCN
jgi:hypothetical protein